MSHSERDVEQVTRQYNLQLPVRISEIPKSRGVRYVGGIHVISLKDWCRWIGDHNLFHVLVGLHHPNPQRERDILREFWRLYKLHKPEHQLWRIVEEHNVDLSRTCPLLLHGDEGRGRKRSPFLLCNAHSLLGFGTVAANRTRKKRPYLLQKLNYSGSTHIHRFILACLPKMVKDHVALQDILTFIAKDSVEMLCDGVRTSHGERLHMAVLNCCGDWMFLAKAGNLARSYSNVQKRPWGPASCPKGICHQCYAGQTGYPFEDLSASPAWKATVHLPEDQPFSSPPVLLNIPHDPSAASGFFTYDLWHAFHLGMGKTFCATALALLSDLMSGGTIDSRFSELTDIFMQWCSETKSMPYLCQITKDMCGWPDRKTFPNGMWSKGHNHQFHGVSRSLVSPKPKQLGWRRDAFDGLWSNKAYEQVPWTTLSIWCLASAECQPLCWLQWDEVPIYLPVVGRPCISQWASSLGIYAKGPYCPSHHDGFVGGKPMDNQPASLRGATWWGLRRKEGTCCQENPSFTGDT